MNLSARQLAKLLGYSARSLSRHETDGVIQREKDGLFCVEKTVPQLFRHFVQRAVMAESLCKRYLPGELEARQEQEWKDDEL